MSERFFVEAAVQGERASLSGDEARHLIRVMRGGVGDEVILFDGTGVEFVGRIASIGKSTVELAIVSRLTTSRERARLLTLAIALPKGDRQKWLVEKATELGAAQIVPLITERGVAQPVEAALARLRRSVIEASKQCGRNRLLEIAAPLDAQELFATCASPVRLIADPSGRPLGEMPLEHGQLIAAIGPEGGFTPEELAAAIEHGWQAVSLGPAILRVETAALAIASWAALR